MNAKVTEHIKSAFSRYFFIFLLLLSHLYSFSLPLSKSPENKKITLQLKYFHQFQFAGYYAALHKGFYEDAGLTVELIEGGTINSISKVLNGEADYGIAANDLLIERLNNKPIVLLASIFQSSPSIFICLKESNIHTAHDLINKRIMLLDEYRDPELMAIFYKEGIQINNINRISTTYNINDLIDGKTDALNAYSTNEAFYLEEKNIPYTIISPKTYGIDFYGDCLFTSEKEIKNHPKRVKAFLEASKKGWEYALKNQDEIIDLILEKYSVNKTREHLEFEANEIQKLILNEYVEIGHINPGRWENIAETCSKMGMISKNYDLNGFIYQQETYNTPAWLKWVLGIAISLSAIVIAISYYLYFFNKQLQKAVSKQTSNLRQKNIELQNEISERIKTVAALKQSEKRFREMIENLPSGAILVEEDESLFSNKKAFEITGYTNSELPDINSWFSTLYPKNRGENIQLYLENKINNFKNASISSITCKNGDRRHIEFHAYKFDNKEIWLINDITERLKTENDLISSENKLRTYIEESPNGLVIFNSNTKVNFANQAFKDLMEISESKLDDICITDFFAPTHLQQNKKLFNQLLNKGKTQGEIFIQTTSGKNIPVYISAVQLINQEFLAFIVDISAIKEAENKLTLALKHAEESDRLKSAFLANMSHEIRTPMNGILGFSQLLLKEDLSQEKKERYIDILTQNGKQLLVIIDNIIDISYLEVNQLKINSSAFSIQQLFDNLQLFFSVDKNRYKKDHLEIRFNNTVSVEHDQISSDYEKINQILINLINNALKFTEKGTIAISSRIEKSLLYITVEDSGIGIPKEKQDIIFERFGQVENTYTRQFGGAGLGLPISKGLIELLGGEIFFESNVGIGSKFEFYIPINKKKKMTKN
ncbi:PAS domain S-box protein [Labilibaculum sp. A4]|uniref:ABC transporter substrate-binding protein n=1 Tax=Labilibaculum euxinus TaxID=2686357 RepID=UPI000F623C18|nr:ABC transporter substrate-binding protein [Labilibaculum euxinus]MDQ1772745.1 ABC transporter substrate-binding protein [Labilibaculum euxinus]MWN78297.1 PAS domain S-box protein [Labilibaculum euxinus]